jgi:hypothetical protein
MEDILIKCIVWIGIIIVLGIVKVSSSNELDIKVVVWIRLIASILILVIGDILLFKYYHAIGSWIALKVVAAILIGYACFDIPAKIAGVLYKRKLTNEDFLINPFDIQLNKLGYKPLILTVILIISQFVGCAKIKNYHQEQLDLLGIQKRVVISDKRFERIYKNHYDTVVYFNFRYRDLEYESSMRCRGLNVGDSATIRFQPSNPANNTLILK